MEKILAIIGGMGPKASLLFHTLLLSEFPKYKHVENDQDFPNIIHLSFGEAVADRMRYVLGHASENPAEEALRQVDLLDYLVRQRNAKMIVGIPCNTFHADPIYKGFRKSLDEKKLKDIHFLHLVEETAEVMRETLSPGTEVGILSTTGEWKIRIYDSFLIKKGFQVRRSDELLQKTIQDCIYNKEWGLKTASTDYSRTVEEVKKVLARYKKTGVKAIVWGCTEFSLISEEISDPALKFFDSTRILANRMIAKALE